MDEVNVRLHTREEKINILEDIAEETTKTKYRREK